MNRFQLTLMLLLMIAKASGQSVQVKGGSSSLYNGYGGGMDIYLNHQTINVSGAVQAGLIQFGLSDAFLYKGMKVAIGDSSFNYSVDGSGLGVQVRGFDIQKGNLSFFGGQVGVQTMLPYYSTFRPKSYGTGLFWCKKHKNVEFRHLSVYSSGQKTFLSSLKYAGRIFQGSTSVGLYQNHVQVTGIGAVAVGHFILAASRTQQTFQSSKLTTNAGAVQFHVDRFTASGAISQMQYLGTTTVGTTATVNIKATDWANVGYSYYQSGKQTLHQVNVTETTRRISAQESFDNQKHVTGNITVILPKLTVSLGRSEALVPAKGWTSTTTISVAMKIKDFAIRLDRLFLPNGSNKITVSGSDWVYSDRVRENEPKFAKYIVEGNVKDSKDQPVRGAAVKIGNITCFSDRDGKFYLRVKHNKRYSVQVVTDDFMMAGKIKVVSASSEVNPGQVLKIIVEVN